MAPITGRKVLFAFVGAFGLIISVNLFMAYSALSTFPGMDVKNSYVASQNFDSERAAQLALGWTVSVTYEPGELVVEVVDKSGRPADVALLNAIVGRPTHIRDDQTPQFQQRGGKFRAPLELGPGKWNLRLKATSLDGTKFHQRLEFEVKG